MLLSTIDFIGLISFVSSANFNVLSQTLLPRSLTNIINRYGPKTDEHPPSSPGDTPLLQVAMKIFFRSVFYQKART